MPDSDRILLLVTSNPKKIGSKSRKRFWGYFDLKNDGWDTIADARRNGLRTDDFRWDHQHKFIAIGDAEVDAALRKRGIPEDRPIYRLLTGKDDRAFCERVSEALAQGWRLYGSPSLAWDIENSCMKAAQAVVWHEADVVK